MSVATAISRYDRTLTLHAGDYTTPLTATDILQLPNAEQLVASGRAGVVGTEAISLPLQLKVDQAALRKFVEGIAPAVERPVATGIISDEKALTSPAGLVAGW